MGSEPMIGVRRDRPNSVRFLGWTDFGHADLNAQVFPSPNPRKTFHERRRRPVLAVDLVLGLLEFVTRKKSSRPLNPWARRVPPRIAVRYLNARVTRDAPDFVGMGRSSEIEQVIDYSRLDGGCNRVAVSPERSNADVLGVAEMLHGPSSPLEAWIWLLP